MSTTSSQLSQTLPKSAGAPAADERPRFGIGHIGLGVSDVDRSAAFYRDIGMRPIANMGRAAIVELRGGTHLIVQKTNDARPGSLDLIVDDIDETHSVLAALGAQPTRIERGNPHDRFTAVDPDGNVLVVNSNHAMGAV